MEVPNGRRRRVRTRGILVFTALTGLLLAASPALGAAHQRGYDQASIDGVKADISVQEPTIPSGDCLLFDVVETGSLQLETGAARCGSNSTLDGNCASGGTLISYVETYVAGLGYSCYWHSNIQAGASHNYVARQKNNTTVVAGYIDGDEVAELGGFTPKVDQGFIWGELTGSQQSCSGNYTGSGAYTNLKRWDGPSYTFFDWTGPIPYTYNIVNGSTNDTVDCFFDVSSPYSSSHVSISH